MDATLRELLDLLVRWTHVIAGIMWIGNSLLFNWLDRNLKPFDDAQEGSQGKIWLLHSGAFYEVEKKLLPAGFPYPEKVHWFMFQNLTTWLSGVGLLVLVYYMGGAALMIDPAVADLSPAAAIAIGVGSLLGGWLVYDLLWRSPIGRSSLSASLISFGLLVLLSYGLSQLLSGRAAYIHIGALLGSLMTGNVWFYIVPSQRELVAATRAGRAQDKTISQRAKLRSIHNNYMTFPVIFIMISNHFPSTFGHQLNWLILAVLMVGSALVRHSMNIRFSYRRWLPAAVGVGAAALAITFGLIAAPRMGARAAAGPVDFTTAQAIINARCVSCHSAQPTDPIFTTAPAGIMLDTPEQIRAAASRIYERAIVTRTMPLANKTSMTDDERATLEAWLVANR